MAVLGSPQGKSFFIGTAELRIGPQNLAGKLDQTYSVGLIDSASLSVEQTTQDLMGGFPQLPVDVAVTGQNSSISAALREYSRRNLQLMLGAGATSADTTDVRTTLTTTSAYSAGATALTVADSSAFANNDIVGIAVQGRPELVTIGQVASKANATNITLVTGWGLASAIPQDAVAIVYKIPAIAVGNLSTVNYFSASLIFQDRATGRPAVFNAWKATIASGVKMDLSPKDFATADFQIKLLVPAAVEYAAGQPLVHLASVIPTYPVGMFAKPSDFATSF